MRVAPLALIRGFGGRWRPYIPPDTPFDAYEQVASPGPLEGGGGPNAPRVKCPLQRGPEYMISDYFYVHTYIRTEY